MSGSNPPPSQQQPQKQRHQQDIKSPPLSQRGGSQIPFEEIAKLFSVPIAEAASTLGVCTSVLKRRCRENGVTKWPYRKVHAGKSLEDVKKDASLVRESSGRGTMESPASASSAFATNFQERSRDQIPANAKFSTVLYQQGSKVVQTERTNVSQHAHLRNIPNFFDEFKYGFPANGLSTASQKWWGTSKDEGKGDALKKETDPVDTEQHSTLDDARDNKSEDSGSASEPASRLTFLRKQAAKDGRESLRLGVSRGHRTHKLSKRERSVLLQVFQSPLSSQWNDNFS